MPHTLEHAGTAPDTTPGTTHGTVSAGSLDGARGPGHGPSDAATAALSVTEIVDRLFAHFDVGGDGGITLSEWLGVISSDRADAVTAAWTAMDTDADGTLSQTEVTAAISSIDSDADGKLTHSERAAAKAEGTAAAELLGGPGHTSPSMDPVPLDTALAAVFSNFDTDHSGTIAVTELLAGLDAIGRHGGPNGNPNGNANVEARLTAAIAAIDTDADGSLSAVEVSAALTALDANQDGSLSLQEVRPDHAGPHGDSHEPDAAIDLVGVMLLVSSLPLA
jgi:Ca2+-binding EF-hand superfamily protein